MACKCAPALVALRDEVNRLFLRRDKASDGCCGNEEHAARRSDHNPTNGYAHALDIDEDIEPGRDLLWLKPILLRDPRCKYVIYERRIAYPDGTDKPYTGVNAHTHHLHLSIKPGTALDTRRWIPAGVTPTIPPEDEMTPAERWALADCWVRKSYELAGAVADEPGVQSWIAEILSGRADHGGVRAFILAHA
jgi:hypothetical protein